MKIVRSGHCFWLIENFSSPIFKEGRANGRIDGRIDQARDGQAQECADAGDYPMQVAPLGSEPSVFR